MKKALLALAAMVAMMIVGCGGADVFDAPEITGVAMDSASVAVTWTPDTTVENNADFSGYNVYVYTDSSELLVEDGEDLNKDNANVITASTYTIAGLSQDTVYYIQVRTLNIDDKVGTYNVNVPFVEASPRPEFTATLSFELDPQYQNETEIALRFADAAKLDEVDGQIDSTADVFFDAYQDSMTQVASPDHRTIPVQVNPKHTVMVNMGQMNFDDLSEAPSTIDNANVDFEQGDLIVLKTEEDNYVKMHIDEVLKAPDWTVTVTYAYQNIANYPHFSP
ncbi:MAG: fibronectin type III domain-containing protein [bacterium]